MSRIYFSYDQTKLQDGSGAQTLRQIGIYVVSSILRVNYLHSPLLKIDSNPGDGITNSEQMYSFIQDLESYTMLSRASKTSDNKKTFDVRRVPTSLFKLRLYVSIFKIIAFFGRVNFRFLIRDFEQILKKNPLFLEQYRKLLQDNKGLVQTNSNPVIHISAHIHWAMAESVGVQSRYLNLDYFDQILKGLHTFFQEKSIPVSLTIHTAVPSKSKKWTAGDNLSEETKSAWHRVGLSKKKGQLELKAIDFESHFGYFENFKIDRREDMIAVWNSMARSNILIMNSSTFSYLAALKTEETIVLCPDFVHPPLTSWLFAKSNNPQIGLALLKNRLESTRIFPPGS